MTSNRPYLVRGLHQWILDNDMTPYLLVDASRPEVVVPEDFVNEGKIVLNISPMAVRDLVLGDDAVRLHARFGGRPCEIHVPMSAVLAIYAKENGRGMIFPADEPAAEQAPEAPPAPQKPTLKVVK
jgi:stringent starvation protein B